MSRSFPAVLALVALAACGGTPPTGASDEAVDPASGTSSASVATPGDLPSFYARFAASVSVSRSGADVVIRSNGLPDHSSPYWGAGHALYVAPHAGMTVNPFRIQEQALELRVPAEPAVAGMSSTPLGTIGITRSGVSIFNQYAAGFQPLDAEIRSFDLWNGHPQGSGLYHHHFEPLALTRSDPSTLVGVLLDGFPVYGPRDASGSLPADLDACNGHVGATADDPQGIYHYHTTTAFPYISGCFRGTAGRATS